MAGDLGLSKAIVACVGGCEPGAQQTAAELGVEVWGPEEIAEHLGSIWFFVTRVLNRQAVGSRKIRFEISLVPPRLVLEIEQHRD